MATSAATKVAGPGLGNPGRGRRTAVRYRVVSRVHVESRWGRRSWSFRVVLGVAAVVAAGAFAETVGAQDGPPAPSSSAVSQYTELVPTGKGPTAPGLRQAQASTLSRAAQAALDDISPAAAKALATIATSSSYGAPATRSDASGLASERSSGGGAAPLGRTFEAAATAASPISDADLIGLLLTLVVVTVGGAGLALQARRT